MLVKWTLISQSDVGVGPPILSQTRDVSVHNPHFRPPASWRRADEGLGGTWSLPCWVHSLSSPSHICEGGTEPRGWGCGRAGLGWGLPQRLPSTHLPSRFPPAGRGHRDRPLRRSLLWLGPYPVTEGIHPLVTKAGLPACPSSPPRHHPLHRRETEAQTSRAKPPPLLSSQRGLPGQPGRDSPPPYSLPWLPIAPIEDPTSPVVTTGLSPPCPHLPLLGSLGPCHAF